MSQLCSPGSPRQKWGAPWPCVFEAACGAGVGTGTSAHVHVGVRPRWYSTTTGVLAAGRDNGTSAHVHVGVRPRWHSTTTGGTTAGSAASPRGAKLGPDWAIEKALPRVIEHLPVRGKAPTQLNVDALDARGVPAGAQSRPDSGVGWCGERCGGSHCEGGSSWAPPFERGLPLPSSSLLAGDRVRERERAGRGEW